MIKLIGFDLDDTLWDVAPIIRNAESHLNQWLIENVPALKFDVISMRELRHEMLIKEPHLVNQITEMRRRLIERAMLLSGLDNQTADRYSHDAIEQFLFARNQITLFDGAENALSVLAKQYRLCALSNGNADINRLGLNHLFNFAFSAEQVGMPKPAPDLFSAALNHSQLSAGQMIYVGDDPKLDVDAAKKLGIYTIWMDRGTKPRGDSKPDQTITRIDELAAAVDQIHSDAGRLG